MSADEKKETIRTLREIAQEVIDMLGATLDEEIEAQLRALHAREGIHLVALAVALLALGQATIRSMEFSTEATVALQVAAGIVSRKLKALPADHAAELTDEERSIARSLGARIPKIGKA